MNHEELLKKQQEFQSRLRTSQWAENISGLDQRHDELMRRQYREQADHYTHQQLSHEDRMQAKTAVAMRGDLHSVRAAVEQHMPTAYDAIDNIRQSADSTVRTRRLHHARGKKLVGDDRGPVLEFDIAGTSYKQFRAAHKGFLGKSVITEDGRELTQQKNIKVSWYNKVLSWLPGIRSRKTIEKKNKEIDQQNEELEALLQGQYGKSQELKVDGKKKWLEHVRKKVSDDGQRTRITMSGPLGVAASNTGEYSIDRLRSYMLTMGQDYLTPFFTRWKDGDAPHDINLIIRGHSRGGVAAAEGAMMIKSWVQNKFPEYLPHLKFDLVQYDPVPGAGSYDKHAHVDHSGKDTSAQNKVDVEPLGPEAETTVVYSMHTQYIKGFTPQLIKGAKRLILTPFTHGVGLDTMDESQGEKRRIAMTDARTGDAYRGSAISELPPGVYVLDEQHTLIRMDSAAQTAAILNSVVKDRKSQSHRHDTLLQAVELWFQNAAAQAQSGGSSAE